MKTMTEKLMIKSGLIICARICVNIDDYLSLLDDQLTPSFLNNEVDIFLDFFDNLKNLPDYKSLELDSVGDLEKNDLSASPSSYFDNLNKLNDRNSKMDKVTKNHNFLNIHDNKMNFTKSDNLFNRKISYVNNF